MKRVTEVRSVCGYQDEVLEGKPLASEGLAAATPAEIQRTNFSAAFKLIL